MRRACLWLLPGFCLAAAAAQTTAQTEFSSAAKAELTQQLNGAAARGDTPGVVGLVVGRDGPLYLGTAGKLDISKNEPMVPDAIFSIASMTKPVTSVAIMMLAEQGKLKLDDPVSKYLPGFDHLQVITKFNPKDATYESRPATRPMTIRHLLTHTSGLAYGFANPVVNRLTEVTKKDETALPLLNEPGEKWNYSPSTAVLGRIVEKISGVTLEVYFQQHIFEPLHMADTSFAVPLSKQGRVATRYSRVNGSLKAQRAKVPSEPKPPLAGDGGLYSTAQDYGKFVQMFLNDGRARSGIAWVKILDGGSVKIMGENNIGGIFVELQPSTDQSISKPFPLGAGHDKFGLGFQIAASNPQFAKFRSPGTMSWAGILNTEFWIDPVKHIGGVQMMQLMPFYDDGAIRTLRDFEAAVYRNLPPTKLPQRVQKLKNVPN